MVDLIFTKGPRAGERFAVKGERVTIGRLSECEVALDSPNVSRRHAVIERDAGRLFIVDNRSGNGTFVNGQRVTRAELQGGAEVRVGAHVFRVELRPPELAPGERPTRLDSLTRFVVEDLTGVARRLEFSSESLKLGRGEGCQLVLEDDETSRLHATVKHRGGRFEIVDADSANGTYLNGQPVATAEVQDGDRIEIGSLALAAEVIDGVLRLTVTRRPAAPAERGAALPSPSDSQSEAAPPAASNSAPRARSSIAPRRRTGLRRYPVVGGLFVALVVALLLILVGRGHAGAPETPRPPVDAARGPVYSSPRPSTLPGSPRA